MRRFEGQACFVLIGGFARITVAHRIAFKANQHIALPVKTGIQWQDKLQQVDQAVRFGEVCAVLLLEGFEVFFGGLLRMKADGIVVGPAACAQFAPRRGVIALRFGDPLSGQVVHTAPCPG